MALTRELIVTYGTYIISTATGRCLDGKVQVDRSWETGRVEFSFFIETCATAAAFATAVSTAETAFRKPYQTLTIAQSGSTLQSVSQANAIDPIPTITKREDVGDTGLSRRYTVVIEFGLPATTGAETHVGLRELSINVSYDEARIRTVTISGTVTANGGTGARDQYDNIIDAIETAAFAAGELNITAANRELVGEPTVNSDTNDKLCEFTREWVELIHSQAGSSNDDAGIVRQRYSVTRRREWPGDSPTVPERLATIDLSYEAWVDSEVSTNLKAKYESIRTWLVTQMSTVADNKPVHITSKVFRPYHDENRFTVEMTGVAEIGTGTMLEQRVTIDDDDLKGTEIVEAWSGSPFAAYDYPGPRVYVRTVTQTFKFKGHITEQEALGKAAIYVGKAKTRFPGGAGGGGKWVIIRERPSATPITLGSKEDGSKELMFTEASVTVQMRYIEPPSSGGSSARPGSQQFRENIISNRPSGAFTG